MKDKLEDKLEWFDGGDGVEYEVWIDVTTNEKYRIPIEIVRDFKNAEKLITKKKTDGKIF